MNVNNDEKLFYIPPHSPGDCLTNSSVGRKNYVVVFFFCFLEHSRRFFMPVSPQNKKGSSAGKFIYVLKNEITLNERNDKSFLYSVLEAHGERNKEELYGSFFVMTRNFPSVFIHECPFMRTKLKFLPAKANCLRLSC